MYSSGCMYVHVVSYIDHVKNRCTYDAEWHIKTWKCKSPVIINIWNSTFTKVAREAVMRVIQRMKHGGSMSSLLKIWNYFLIENRLFLTWYLPMKDSYPSNCSYISIYSLPHPHFPSFCPSPLDPPVSAIPI